MSFGGHTSAFGRSRPTLPPAAACPCGAGRFGECCGPVLAGGPAGTAVALMRSRFTAFALGDAHHLLESWHPSTRPESLDLDGDREWESLAIVDAVDGGPDDRRGTVEFRARWRDRRTGSGGELAERSRFLGRDGRWWYLDGDVSESPASRPSF